MGAGDDFLAWVAAFLHAVAIQAVQAQLLRGPHFALAFVQARQSVAQVGLAPGEGGLIGFAAGCNGIRRPDAQGARQGVAAQVQLPAVTCSVRDRGAAGSLGCSERTGHGQIAAHLYLHLATEHEALQLRRNRIGIAVGQHQHHVIVGQPEQLEHCQGAALGTQPGAPLPVQQGQGGDIAAELGVGEGGRIRALQAQQLVAGQARISDESRGQVVRHVNEV